MGLILNLLQISSEAHIKSETKTGVFPVGKELTCINTNLLEPNAVFLFTAGIIRISTSSDPSSPKSRRPEPSCRLYCLIISSLATGWDSDPAALRTPRTDDVSADLDAFFLSFPVSTLTPLQPGHGGCKKKPRRSFLNTILRDVASQEVTCGSS